MTKSSYSPPRFIISGTGPAVGKSLLSLGLVHELRKRRVSVSCAVIGPNLTEAALLKRISGRYVRCLDDRLLSANQNIQSVHHASIGADIVLIEGRAGLYDGYTAGTLRGSDAEIASLTRSPVLLVTDPRSLGSSIVALVKGYQALAKDFLVPGVVLNRVGIKTSDDDIDARDGEYYNALLQAFALPLAIGAIPDLPLVTDIPVGGISQAHNQTTLSRQFFLDLGQIVEHYVDIDRILELASLATPIDPPEAFQPLHRKTRIAVSDDSCFHLCFQDNLDLLRYYGADLIPFSPLADSELPKNIGGVYLTGACLLEYGAELSANKGMRESIRRFMDAGGALYAEGGGTAYLCDTFRPTESIEKFEGVGGIPGHATPGPRKLTYRDAVTVEDSIFGRSGLIIKGVDTQDWHIAADESAVRVLRFSGAARGISHEGFSPHAQSLATLSFLHFGSNPEIVRNFVESAEVGYKL